MLRRAARQHAGGRPVRGAAQRRPWLLLSGPLLLPLLSDPLLLLLPLLRHPLLLLLCMLRRVALPLLPHVRRLRRLAIGARVDPHVVLAHELQALDQSLRQRQERWVSGCQLSTPQQCRPCVPYPASPQPGSPCLAVPALQFLPRTPCPAVAAVQCLAGSHLVVAAAALKQPGLPLAGRSLLARAVAAALVRVPCRAVAVQRSQHRLLPAPALHCAGCRLRTAASVVLLAVVPSVLPA
jgi:hypothetical protein